MDKKDARQVSLQRIIKDMDVPDTRRDTTQRSNLRWLARNLAIRNGAHPDIKRALHTIRDLLVFPGLESSSW